MNIGVAGICLMNIIWLQAAPMAFQTSDGGSSALDLDRINVAVG